MRARVLELGTSWLVRPVVYALLVLVLLPFAIARRDRFALTLAASALLAELSLFAIAPTPDFRYSIWLVPVAAVLLAFAISSQIARRAARRSSPSP